MDQHDLHQKQIGLQKLFFILYGMQNKITFWTHHIILDGVGHWGLNLALQVVVDGHHPQNTLLHEHPPAQGLHHTPVA